jgi:hypothetical protein
VSKLRGILHLGTPPTLEIPPIETIDSHDHQATPAGNGNRMATTTSLTRFKVKLQASIKVHLTT